MAPKLLTTGEVAREMGVTPATVARWARDGWITPAKVTAGGHYRWDLETVERQLTERQQRGERPPAE
jgi:excisionase family DNA binding protein